MRLVALKKLKKTWPELSFLKPSAITSRSVQEWASRMKVEGTNFTPPGSKTVVNGNSATSVNRAIDTLRRLMDIAIERGMIHTNPVTVKPADGSRLKKKIKKPRLELPSFTEVQKLFLAIENNGAVSDYWFFRYPIASATARTRSLVAFGMTGLWLGQRETVGCDTPARAATSGMVAPGFMRGENEKRCYASSKVTFTRIAWLSDHLAIPDRAQRILILAACYVRRALSARIPDNPALGVVSMAVLAFSLFGGMGLANEQPTLSGVISV